MPYRRKDSAVWWASYVDASGQRVRCTTGTIDRKEAKALEAKWKLEAFRATQWDEQPSRSFEDLMVSYLKATERFKRSSGHRRDVDSIRRLRSFFGGYDLSKLNAASIRGYIDHRMQTNVGPGTINRELCTLSAALNYARREWEWDVPNPIPGRKLREPEGRVRWLTRVEADSLIRVACQEANAPHLPDFIRLALNTGCRKGELLGLEWNRVDLDQNLIHLEGRHTKTGKRRSIPLNRESRQAIEGRKRFHAAFCPESKWVFAHKTGERILDVKRAFTTACARAGVENFRIHDLRHTCAAWLVSGGVPLAEVRDVLGHTTVTMTERYAHLASENIRAAVAVLDRPKSRFGHVTHMREEGEIA